MKKILANIFFVFFIGSLFLAPFSLEKKNDSTQQTIILVKNISYAQTPNGGTPPGATSTTSSSSNSPSGIEVKPTGYLDCSWYDFACQGINFLQLIFVVGGNILVGISAFIMDTFLFHSLQSSSYSDSKFIVQGWEILRDLTNIIFIFALLVTAFKMVLGQDDAGNKRTLLRTIVVALVINFSLFISFAIIDVSNLFAYTFYNKIEQQEIVFDASSNPEEIQSNEVFEGKSTSLAIAKKINPQRILTPPSEGYTMTRSQRLIVVLMAGAINGTLIYVFLSVSFLFLGRTIGLWLSTILSPLALASITVPKLEKMKYIGFSNWLSSTLQMAFMAPVFIFFLYLAVQFMEIDIGFAGSQSGDFINNILNIVIPMAAIVALLITAKKVASSMSGDFAGTITEIAGKVAGGAVAAGAVVATGGAAALGGISRGAAMLAPKDSAFSKGAQTLGKRAQAMNFNFAQTKLGKFASKQTGLNLGANLGNLSYARLDSNIRKTANSARAGYSNFTTGKTAESVQKWQDTIQESRDNLTSTRIENKQRQESKAAEGKLLTKVDSDGNKEESNNINLEETLSQLESRLARRDSETASNEAKSIQNQKQAQQIRIDSTQDEIKNINGRVQQTQKDIQKFQKTGDTGAIAGAQAQIEAFQKAIREKRSQINNIKETIKDIDKTSLQGQISQIKKQIDSKKNDARANLLQDDATNRRTTQDSGLTYPETRRQERVDKQASRVGSGKIKSTPKIGGDDKPKEPKKDSKK